MRGISIIAATMVTDCWYHCHYSYMIILYSYHYNLILPPEPRACLVPSVQPLAAGSLRPEPDLETPRPQASKHPYHEDTGFLYGELSNVAWAKYCLFQYLEFSGM